MSACATVMQGVLPIAGRGAADIEAKREMQAGERDDGRGRGRGGDGGWAEHPSHAAVPSC